VIRVHFTSADLARVRIAVLGPLAETQLSFWVAQHNGEAALFDAWRSQARPRLTVGDLPGLVRGLAPARQRMVDLFTLAGTASEMEDALDLLLSDPRPLRDELALYRRGRRLMLPPWMLSASTGDGRAARHVAEALTTAYQATIARHWPRMRAALHREQDAAMRALACGGIGQMLSSLHPAIRWRPPLLEVDYRPLARGTDVHLTGGGMVIAPSVFCRAPRLYVGRSEELMLIYPVLRSTLTAAEVFGGAARSRAVADLLGRTRAAVLEAADGRLTTGEIARRLGVSPASASQHTAVLREAGLISSHRQGKTVHHTITSLGKALLDGHF
jgi:DNA-binding transcriptional ArsR family regulator